MAVAPVTTAASLNMSGLSEDPVDADVYGLAGLDDGSGSCDGVLLVRLLLGDDLRGGRDDGAGDERQYSLDGQQHAGSLLVGERQTEQDSAVERGTDGAR